MLDAHKETLGEGRQLARMIPPLITSTCASPGERDLFLRLRDDPHTSDWIVLHSLDIAEHRRQVSGEVDFICVIPEKGVLFLEVKACRRLRREDGMWFYGSESKGDPRGPFKQVSESMHSLRKKMVERYKSLANLVCWTCVVLPYVALDAASPEWHEWQFVDSRVYNTRTIGVLLERVIDKARERLAITPTAGWFDPEIASPTGKQLEDVVDALSPNFEVFESGNSRARRLDEELKYFTGEQVKILDFVARSPRVVISGPAGTGKTLLALEAVRRAVAQNMRVLLLCFNRNLAAHLAQQVEYAGDRVQAVGLHRLMLETAGVRPPRDARSDYWHTTLPGLALEALLDRLAEERAPFDMVVVDEAQDVLGAEALDFLDLLLVGGLGSGKWLMCGDFEDQAIFSSGSAGLDSMRWARGIRFVPLELAINCRNTPTVARVAEYLGGLDPGYSDIRRPDDESRPVFRFYEDAQSQVALLAEALLELKAEGFALGEMVILSLSSGENSAASGLTAKGGNFGQWLQPFTTGAANIVGFSSIHAFKGLEASVVVVTDISSVDDRSRELLYIASTRALQRLVFLVDANAKDDFLNILEDGVGKWRA